MDTTKLTDLVPFPFEMRKDSNLERLEAHSAFLSSLSNKELLRFLEWKTNNGIFTELSAIDAVFLNRIKDFQKKIFIGE